MDAIADGETPDPLIAKLREEESRKKLLVEELDQLINPQVFSLDRTKLKREIRERVTDIKSLLERHVPQAWQILRKVLEDKLSCTPVKDKGREGYQVTGKGTYARLLPSTLVSTTVASPTGFEPGWNKTFDFEIQGFALVV